MAISDSLRQFFSEMPGGTIEQRVVDYIVQEIDEGRRLDDIFSDPYVKNRLSDSGKAALLDNPEIGEAVSQEIRESFSDMSDEI